MPETEVVESGATETATTEEIISSGETQTTAFGPVPYDRFQKVNEDKKAAIEERDALADEKEVLQGKLDAQILKTKDEVVATTAKDLAEPPAGLSQREITAWYVRHDSRAMFEQEMGVSMEDMKALIATIPEASRSASEGQWERLCNKHGLDSSNQDVQDTFEGLGLAMKRKTGAVPDYDKVMKRVKDLMGTKHKKPPSPSDTPTTSVSSQIAVQDVQPKTAQEANKYARDGVRARPISTTDILRAGK